MARIKTIIELLDELQPKVRKAFEDSISRVTSDIKIRALEDAIRDGDIELAVRIISPDRSHFAPLTAMLTEVYTSGGDMTFRTLAASARRQGTTVSGFFDAQNSRAQAYLADRSSGMITGPSGSIQEIQRNVRRVIGEAAGVGTSPRTTALNIAGRVNRVSGKREGGVIGLDDQRTDWYLRARSELLSGDPERMQRYLKRKVRNKTFDPLVERAIENGGTLPQSAVDRIMVKFNNNLLRDRAETISRTETIRGLNAAQDEGLEQMMEREGLSAEAVVRIWDASEDGATRESHRFMDGQRRPKGQTFTSGEGNELAFPGDPTAPASETINCRCYLRVDVDFTSLLGPGD